MFVILQQKLSHWAPDDVVYSLPFNISQLYRKFNTTTNSTRYVYVPMNSSLEEFRVKYKPSIHFMRNSMLFTLMSFFQFAITNLRQLIG